MVPEYYVSGKNTIMDEWISEWRQHYYPKKLLDFIGHDKRFSTVLDVGAGPDPISLGLNAERIYLIDIVPMIKSFSNGNVYARWEDINHMLEGKGFTFIDEPIECIINSHILNYVSWKKLLVEESRLQTSGGYNYISNIMGKGVPRLFSDNPPKNHKEIIGFLLNIGYDVSEVNYDNGFLLLSAMKL